MSALHSVTLVGCFTVTVGLLAMGLGPWRQSFLENVARQGFVIPFILPYPIVHDPAQNIKYVGTVRADVEHFQNIFYAADTSGENRFAPPVHFSPAPGSVIDATRAGAWCSQGTGDVLPFTSRITNVSENCLSLRIARPRTVAPNAELPVIVWLHGGGHALGSAYDALYEPDGLVSQAAADGQPLIFVGVNYRLGMSDALIESKHTNVGLRDQRAALEWVRDNIHLFGGDPARVTAIGQSVGAGDISLQLTAFAGEQGAAFSQAVMMSGGPGLNFNTMSDLVRNNTASIADQVGCVGDGNAQSPRALACLRGVPADQLTNLSVTMSRAARPPFGEGFFFPTFDGDFLRDRPTELMRAGKFVKGVSIIASWVTNEGAWYAPPTTSTDEEVLSTFGLWLHGHSSSTKSRLLELYPLADFEHMVRPEVDGPISAQYYRAAQINRDLWFTCPVMDFAWQYVRHGGASPGDVRLYEHNATRFASAYDSMGTPMWRVAHLSDIPYVFNNPRIADKSSQQMELSKLISRSIIQFVNTGNPEGRERGLRSWPPAFQSDTDELVPMPETPTEFTVHLFGGPSGHAPVRISRAVDEEMSEAQKSIAWEKILERCEFINSEAVRDESGV